jgi:DNA mismatch repair protein MutS2
MLSMGGSLQEIGLADHSTSHQEGATAPQAEVFIPDLLDATPTLRIQGERTKLAAALAFAAGGSGGLFGDALDRATVPVSTWEASSFAKDLFLQTFVTHCFKARIGAEQPVMATAHLVKVLASPPADPAVIQHRRAILGELVSSADLRRALERLYGMVCRFRGLLEGAMGIGKWDANRRQLDVLQVFREMVDGMASSFATASSGLARLATFGRRLQAGEPYRSLCDLLRFDENLATVNLQVRVGAEGRVRGLEIVSLRENVESPFVGSVWRRWMAKIELFMRGYRFGDGEVMARLIYAVFDGLKDEFVPFVQLLGDIEFYLGALGFHDLAAARGLGVCLPELALPGEPRVLLGLFNPFLLVQGVKVVACDLHIDRHDTTVLLTGPNSGGKTRLLQSLGIAQLLAQSGVFVPARFGCMALTPGLVVSLIQETSADQAEGRLGTELLRIRDLFENLAPGAMVILDELCSGTNPSEGEEIFELVVNVLTRLRPQTFITTHFLAFAARLQEERRIADLRFLQVELGPGQEPTYRFVPGVARTSLASHAAARLGVTGEQLTSVVERNLARARFARGRGRG